MMPVARARTIRMIRVMIGHLRDLGVGAPEERMMSPVPEGVTDGCDGMKLVPPLVVAGCG